MTKDLLIYESLDGGDLRLLNNDLVIITCATNQVYLALFGGNKEQLTSQQISSVFEHQNLDWWGNSLLSVENQFNSRTEKIINEIAITKNGINKLHTAVEEDLAFLQKYYNIATNIRLISYNHIQIFVTLQTKTGQLIIKFDCSEKIDLSYSTNGIDFIPANQWLWSDNQNDVTLFSDSQNDVGLYK